MAILRIGKARESTMLKSEDYKSHVRKYIESFGFAQTTDSYTEGNLPDMIFVPLDDNPNHLEQWIEVKASEISLIDDEFIYEIKSYLSEWLIRRPEARFHFWIFIKKLKNPDKWHKVFGNQLNEESIIKWLQKKKHSSDVIENRITSADFNLIVSFFSETYIIEAEANDLDIDVEERKKTNRSLMGFANRAHRILDIMEKRSRPLQGRSNLIANLINMKPPSQFVEMEIEPKTLEEIRQSLKDGPRPPFGIIAKNRIFTIASDNIEEDFASLHVQSIKNYTLKEVEKLYETELISLLNRSINSIIRRCGVYRNDFCFYFRASKDVQKGKNRIIKIHNKSLTVASPKYKEDEAISSADEIEYLGSLRTSMPKNNTKHLNYVYHEGFKIRCRCQWDSYYILIQLHKAFTSDGDKPLDGAGAARLDEYYRKPEFNRSDAQIHKLEVITDYLFDKQDIINKCSSWAKQFNFKGLLTFPIQWKPEPIDFHNSILIEPDIEANEEGDFSLKENTDDT